MRVYVCVCVYIFIYKYADSGSDPKKIIPDPQHWFGAVFRIHMFLASRILLSSCKNSKKNLDSFYFVTLFDFLSLKNDVNVPSKSNKQQKLVFCWHLEGQ